MPKSLRDLNWPFFLISMIEAVTIACCISAAADFSWRGFSVTTLGLCGKAARDFFSEAKKQLSDKGE